MLRAAAVSSLFWLLACGSADRAFVALPDHGSSTILLVQRPDSSATFELIPWASRSSQVLELESDGEVYVLHYEASLEELGLTEGGTRRCLLLVPRVIDRLDELQFRTFEGALPANVQRALVEQPGRCAPCRPLDMQAVNYPEVGTLGAGGWLDSGPLVTGLAGRFRRVDPSGSTLIEGCAFSEVPGDTGALVPLSHNRFWFGGDQGDLGIVRFDEEAARCEVETSTLVRPTGSERRYAGIRALAADPFGMDPNEVYALIDDGRIIRHALGRTVLVGTLPLHPLDVLENGASIGGFLILEDGRALATIGSNQIAWWGPDGIERIDTVELPANPVAADLGQRVTALVLDQFGLEPRLLAGAASGIVLAYDPSARKWLPILAAPTKAEVRGFERFGDRWLVVIENGDVVVWHPETGMCKEQFRLPLSTNSSRCAHRARRGAELAIFDAIGDNDRPSGVVWITDD